MNNEPWELLYEARCNLISSGYTTEYPVIQRIDAAIQEHYRSTMKGFSDSVEAKIAEEGKVHAEITYDREDGVSVHSDICPQECQSKNITDENYRKFLHASLEEWLNTSRGTGGFYIGAAILKEDLNMELGDKLYKDL